MLTILTWLLCIQKESEYDDQRKHRLNNECKVTYAQNINVLAFLLYNRSL